MKPLHEISTRDGVPESWKPLLELAVREVFEIMLGCNLKITTDLSTPVPGEFTAMVGLAGQLCGVITLRCSAKSAVLMTSKMLRSDPKDADQHVWDALGEIANMVAGNFKSKLTGMAERCMLSVPTVVTGDDYHFHSLANTSPLEIMFLFEDSPALVSLEVHS